MQTAAVLVVLLAAAATASRSDRVVLKADIPFPFVVAITLSPPAL